jgi:hypothetical protein
MSTAKHRTFLRRRPFAVTGVLCASLIALAGCGGSSSSSPQSVSTTQHAQATPLQSNPDVGQAAAQQTHGSAVTESNSSARAGAAHGKSAISPSQEKWIRGRLHAAGKVQKARPEAPATNSGEDVPNGVKAVNPCSLVSRSEAQTITGRAVAASTEAPLGPTCIYEFRGSKAEITLAVESMSLSQATNHLRNRTPINVRTRHGYCGRLGTGTLFVPLPGGHVLNVTAPCSVAQRFATLALGRLAL